MTKLDQDSGGHPESFNKLINILEQNYKYLKSIAFDNNLLEDYSLVLKYLRSLSPDQLNKIISSNEELRKSGKKDSKSDFSDEQILNFTLENLEEIISDKKNTRKTLEKIAFTRFNMTKSESTSIKNKELLIERIQSCINNEKTHESISRVAMKKDKESIDFKR